MQHAVSNRWLDPSLVAFAEEQHAQLGRRRGSAKRSSTRGKQQLGRSTNGLALRVSVFGLLLSSAAFSYFAWSNTLGSLPVASAIGRALGSSNASSTTAAITADASSASGVTQRVGPPSPESSSITADGMATDALQPSLKEQVYHLRAENHALQLRLSKLREQMKETEMELLRTEDPRPAGSTQAAVAMTD